MITHQRLWRRTEASLLAREPRSYARARRVFEALYEEARRLKVLPSRNPLEGLEKNLRLAKALNSLRA